jgi:hypothetical protein
LEAIMRAFASTLIALAALTIFGNRPSQAYYDGRWCAVSSMGRGGAIERCDFNSFEACRMEVIAGNRGFCRPNSYWSGSYAAEPPVHRKARRHRHRH